MKFVNPAQDLETNILVRRSPSAVTVEVLCLAYEPGIQKI
jgi:hypothetical protein